MIAYLCFLGYVLPELCGDSQGLMKEQSFGEEPQHSHSPSIATVPACVVFLEALLWGFHSQLEHEHPGRVGSPKVRFPR